jgi:hypothetical protein
MIHTKFNARLLLLIGVLFILFHPEGYSQGTDIRSGKQKHFYLGFSFSPAQTGIAYTGASTISSLNSAKKSSFSGSFEIGYSFSKVFGISTGVGYSSYAADLTLASYTSNYDTTDSEHESYTRFIDGNNITETQKISFVEIPLALNLHIPFSDNFGMYIQSGVNFSIPMQKTFTSSGTFSYSGYYSAYKVLLEGVSYEGFLSDNNNNVSGNLSLKSMYQELFASAGFQLTFQSVWISVGGFYSMMLSDLSGSTSTSTGVFRLSTKPDQMRSMMDGSTKSKASAMGLKITLRFYL